jgi:hypothetical protein
VRAVRSYVLLFWLTWVALALALCLKPNGALVAGFGFVLLPVICYLWCKADSAARAVRAPPGAVPLMAVAPVIGWAYYLFGTRPPLKALTVVVSTLVVAVGIVMLVPKLVFDVGGYVAT